MDTIGIAEQIAYFGSTEIIEATEVAPDTVVGHMMLVGSRTPGGGRGIRAAAKNGHFCQL